MERRTAAPNGETARHAGEPIETARCSEVTALLTGWRCLLRIRGTILTTRTAPIARSCVVDRSGLRRIRTLADSLRSSAASRLAPLDGDADLRLRAVSRAHRRTTEGVCMRLHMSSITMPGLQSTMSDTRSKRFGSTVHRRYRTSAASIRRPSLFRGGVKRVGHIERRPCQPVKDRHRFGRHPEVVPRLRAGGYSGSIHIRYIGIRNSGG